MQTFDEASQLGADYRTVMCGTAPEIDTAQGLHLSALHALPRVSKDDLVVVPGFRLHDQRAPASLVRWLREAHDTGAHIASVCTGAFVLGKAGLLDDRRCTTHWKRVRELQRAFPRARVVKDMLFVRDGNVTSSAGIASGIDMALALVDEHHGPVLAARVAREMVVYMRRPGGQGQGSVYLDYRTHLSSGIHEVQDHLIAHPETHDTLADLARIARMSPRSLTRVFRQATGTSVLAFRTRVRLERARTLMHDPGLTLERVAELCGFADARQLRRLWKKTYGVPPRRAATLSRARA